MGLPQDDGFSTVISIGGTNLYEIDITPPGIDGGGPIDITTMRNTAFRTAAAKSLKTMSSAPFTAAYSADAYGTLMSVVNVNQALTYTFPDASGLVIWGYLDKFTPDGSAEGERPTATCEIVFTNIDAAGAEIAPLPVAAP